MNNNPYTRNYIPNYSNYNQQNIDEQIDYQIRQLQQMKEQHKNNPVPTPAINQTFQISPTSNNSMKYANTIEDVSKEQVFYDTPFFSKDMSVVWIKNTKGDIKTYELTEIVLKDDKDLQIELLQEQINELKGMIKNESNVTNVENDDAKQSTTSSTEYDEPTRTEIKSTKSTSIQEISRSKKK